MAVTAEIINNPWFRLGLVDDTNNAIYCIVAGNPKNGKIIRFVGNLTGKAVDPLTGKLHLLNPGEDPDPGEDELQTLIRKFGKRFVRIPIIQNLKPLKIDRVTFKTTKEKGSRLKDQLNAETIYVYGLLDKFPRPTYHEAFDGSKNLTFGVISTASIEVIDARPAFELYADNLLEILSQKISGYLSGVILKLSYDDYKKRGNELTALELNGLNKIIAELGLTATSLTLSDPELPEEIQKEMEQGEIATVKANAKAEEGRGLGDYHRNVAKGQAEGIGLVGKAEAGRVGSMIDMLKTNGVARKDAALLVTETSVRLATATAIGNLKGTVAVGGNPNMSILAGLNGPIGLTGDDGNDDSTDATPSDGTDKSPVSSSPLVPVVQSTQNRSGKRRKRHGK